MHEAAAINVNTDLPRSGYVYMKRAKAIKMIG